MTREMDSRRGKLEARRFVRQQFADWGWCYGLGGNITPEDWKLVWKRGAIKVTLREEVGRNSSFEATVREAFRLAGSSAPYEALEAFGLTRPRTLLADLRELHEYRKAGRITDLEYAAFAHALREDMLTLHAHGDIDAAARSEFETNYAANINELTNQTEENENAKDK